MKLPAGYNKVQESPHRVWTECGCGWTGKKYKPGRQPKMVVFTPFYCPKCGEWLSDHTQYR